MRTRGSITAGAWPEGSENNSAGFERPPYYGFGSEGSALLDPGFVQTDATCEAVNRRTITSVWDALTPGEQASSAFRPDNSTLVASPDAVATSGPGWTNTINLGGTGFIEPLVNDSGVLKARASRLFVEWNETVTIGPRANGAFYCSLVAPEYLRDVLRGDATAPSA
jgi:hypothetical protein